MHPRSTYACVCVYVCAYVRALVHARVCVCVWVCVGACALTDTCTHINARGHVKCARTYSGFLFGSKPYKETLKLDPRRGSSVEIGMIQKKLARPLRKDDTPKSRSALNSCPAHLSPRAHHPLPKRASTCYASDGARAHLHRL